MVVVITVVVWPSVVVGPGVGAGVKAVVITTKVVTGANTIVVVVEGTVVVVTVVVPVVLVTVRLLVTVPDMVVVVFVPVVVVEELQAVTLQAWLMLSLSPHSTPPLTARWSIWRNRVRFPPSHSAEHGPQSDQLSHEQSLGWIMNSISSCLSG